MPDGTRTTDFENEVRALREQVADLRRQLLHAQKMESVGRLSGGVAHDFNNLLTPIISYAHLVTESLPPESTLRNYVQEIQSAGVRATDLIRQLLAFSRQGLVEPKVVSLNDLILGMEKILRRLIDEDIELVILPASHLGLVKVDPGQIEQVLVNLAVNAQDAMPEGGTLTIETADTSPDGRQAEHAPVATPSDHVMLAVSDTGIGMTEDVRARVFEPFFTTKETGKGTGLGLSTCHEIVSQTGGHITIESQVENGSTFRVYLPKVDEPLSVSSPYDDCGSLPVGTETVLLVDDAEAVRAVASRVLAKQGYTVLEAANGDEGIRVIERSPEEKIHLLVTDVVMPLMSGAELVRHSRNLSPETKILYISGYTENDGGLHGVLNSGASFLRKPFTVEALTRKVRDVLDTPQALEVESPRQHSRSAT